MEKYVLIDRNGVINVRMDEPIKSPDEFVFCPSSIEAIFALTRADIRSIVLTNEEALVHGGMDFSALDAIHAKMHSMIEEAGGRIHDVLVCPENNRDRFDGWYPNPGLLQKAAKKHGFNLRDTYFIGARYECLEAAWAAGCKSAFVRSGKPYKTLQILRTSERQPDLNEPDLMGAALKIVRLYQTR